MQLLDSRCAVARLVFNAVYIALYGASTIPRHPYVSNIGDGVSVWIITSLELLYINILIYKYIKVLF